MHTYKRRVQGRPAPVVKPDKTSTAPEKTLADFSRPTRGQVDEAALTNVPHELLHVGALVCALHSLAPLTEAEVEFLDEYSGATQNLPAVLSFSLTTEAKTMALAASCLTVEDVAQRLGISPSRVRRRLAEGSVYAFPSLGRGHVPMLPPWQFTTDDQFTPHLGSVLSALPADFLPLDIEDFALHACVEQPGSGRQVAVLEWLRAGGDPNAAIALALEEADTL
jgi:hypothetical protein